MAVSFFVAGRPEPQGSKNVGRHGQLYEQNASKLRSWQEVVAYEALSVQRRRQETLYEGPVSLYVEFFFLRPASHLTSKGSLRKGAPLWHVYKPDLDKLCRAIQDALSNVLYGDDRQVVDLFANKYWTLEPEQQGAVIVVNELRAEEEVEMLSRSGSLFQ